MEHLTYLDGMEKVAEFVFDWMADARDRADDAGNHKLIFFIDAFTRHLDSYMDDQARKDAAAELTRLGQEMGLIYGN